MGKGRQTNIFYKVGFKARSSEEKNKKQFLMKSIEIFWNVGVGFIPLSIVMFVKSLIGKLFYNPS